MPVTRQRTITFEIICCHIRLLFEPWAIYGYIIEHLLSHTANWGGSDVSEGSQNVCYTRQEDVAVDAAPIINK